MLKLKFHRSLTQSCHITLVDIVTFYKNDFLKKTIFTCVSMGTLFSGLRPSIHIGQKLKYAYHEDFQEFKFHYF